MLFHEQENDETTETKYESHGGKKEGKENLFNPMARKMFGDCAVS